MKENNHGYYNLNYRTLLHLIYRYKMYGLINDSECLRSCTYNHVYSFQCCGAGAAPFLAAAVEKWDVSGSSSTAQATDLTLFLKKRNTGNKNVQQKCKIKLICLFK